MRQLIEILEILLKYSDIPDSAFPLAAEHEIVWFQDVDPNKVSVEDINRLDALGVHIDTEYNCFAMYV